MSLCLMLAFASYGTVAAASAHSHAHTSDSAHHGALHAVVSDADVDTDHDHHDIVEVADDHASTPADQSNGPMHGGFHVHSVAVFTTVDEPMQVVRLETTTPMSWIEPAVPAVAGLFSPLKKPPRI